MNRILAHFYGKRKCVKPRHNLFHISQWIFELLYGLHVNMSVCVNLCVWNILCAFHNFMFTINLLCVCVGTYLFHEIWPLLELCALRTLEITFAQQQHFCIYLVETCSIIILTYLQTTNTKTEPCNIIIIISSSTYNNHNKIFL